jgi:hypothetical protein
MKLDPLAERVIRHAAIYGECFYSTGEGFIGLSHLRRDEENPMTSSVLVTAHCAANTAVRIQLTGQAKGETFTLRDGESKELAVYDEREVRVREVACEVEKDAVDPNDPAPPPAPEQSAGLTGDPVGGTPGPTEGPGGPGTLSQEAINAHAEFEASASANNPVA